MPDIADMKYVITISRMMKCDEADVVMKWSAVIAEPDLKYFGGLGDAAKLTAHDMEGFPGTNLRPMTEEEIAVWRAEEDDDDE